ncbi:MAG: hypothetical protein JSS75_05320 [Bacteroidetes bacterium]|nr:hypothetical protein [Bacteroidota bacterium]
MKLISIVFLLLGLIALGVGIYMFADPSLLSALNPTMRIVLAAILVLYGGFRLSTAIGGLRKKQQGAQ